MKDLISVIVPAYNHERYVQETIWSIINQTYQNLELIIINDGSKDKTNEKILELEEECKKRFTNFKYSVKKNAGVAEALNDGIDAAQGKFVYLIASDDVSKPDAITTLYDFINDKPEYALVVGDDDFIDTNSSVVTVNQDRVPLYGEDIEKAEYKFKTVAHWGHKANNRCCIDFNSEFFGTYVTLFHNCYVPNGYLINRQAIIDVGKYKKGCVDDWYMFLQLAKTYKFKYIDKVLFSYRCHKDNSQKNSKYMKKIIKNLFKNEKEYCYKNGYKKAYDTKIMLMYFDKIPKRIEKLFRGLFKVLFKDCYYFHETLSDELVEAINKRRVQKVTNAVI